MIRKVQRNPENVFVASDYKKIGQSLELNRQRVANVVNSISRANTNAQLERLDNLVGTDGITDAEKPSLARELDSIMRDFDYLSTETRNADLGDSDEYHAVKDSYDRVVDLMSRIVNSVGTYTNSDVNYLTLYYSDYTNNAITLGNLILSTTAELDKINAYYSMTSAGVNIYPELVAVNTSTTVTASLTYEGEEKIFEQGVPAASVSFGLNGLSDNVTSSMFGFNTTLYPNARVEITALTHSAVVYNCKQFTLSYDAIGSDGVSVTVSISLDSDSMPF